AAVDETIDSTRCGGKSNCQNEQPCLTHDLWMGLSDQIRHYLDSISLQDVLQRKGVRRVARRQDQQAAAEAAAAAAAASVEIPLQRDIRA
ncbi:MAG: Rrf2 family transcriptional regulator, partial [Methylococcaceae bacterium]|nr:Rrf2 family transcriptional regulator [Methylococcaceae bacterium]